ncbi:hypothetical protein [Nocardia coffeae]|uniref:hypothetical protein n=1 Tax=Nocardia coffeae TaxID=2873381 RepID=UPI001F1D9C7E|nr:hypothetical protein [Nocardia coffeae]
MQDAIFVESTPVTIPEAHQFYGAAMPDSSSDRSPRRAADRLLPLAVGLFAIGLVAILAIFLIPVFSDAHPGLWLYLVAMVATPGGLLLAIVFALWSGRRAR